MTIQLTLADSSVDLIVSALRYYAYNEAAQSQQPNLLIEEDFPEWALADIIESEVAEQRGGN